MTAAYLGYSSTAVRQYFNSVGANLYPHHAGRVGQQPQYDHAEERGIVVVATLAQWCPLSYQARLASDSPKKLALPRASTMRAQSANLTTPADPLTWQPFLAKVRDGLAAVPVKHPEQRRVLQKIHRLPARARAAAATLAVAAATTPTTTTAACRTR